MSESLADVLTVSALRRMVDGQTFRRGETYHADGAVRSLTALDSAIQARVQGTHLYRVRRWIDAAVDAGGFVHYRDAYLAEVRTRHKPKRNFIKLLDQSKLG